MCKEMKKGVLLNFQTIQFFSSCSESVRGELNKLYEKNILNFKFYPACSGTKSPVAY